MKLPDASNPKAYGKAQYNSLSEFKAGTNRSCISIWSWNINGFNACMNKKIFDGATSGIFAENIPGPDILCLGEIKITEENVAKGEV